jgi:hypothetical protein
MGDCKTNMKPSSNDDTTKDKSIFGNLVPGRKKKDSDKGTAAETYADNIAKADKKLQELIIQKGSDLSSEKSQELANSLKLGNLKNQQMHLDAIIDLMNDYVEIK